MLIIEVVYSSLSMYFQKLGISKIFVFILFIYLENIFLFSKSTLN